MESGPPRMSLWGALINPSLKKYSKQRFWSKRVVVQLFAIGYSLTSSQKWWKKKDSLSCLVTLLYVINIDNNAMDGDDKVAQIAGLGQIIATKEG